MNRILRNGAKRLISGSFAAVLVVGLLASRADAQQAQQNMRKDVEERSRKSAVLVFTAMSQNTKGDTKMGSGSGYFINNSGLLISNNHVVDPTHMQPPAQRQMFHYQGGKLTWTVVVNSGTGEEKEYEAVVLYQNEWADMALLQAFTEDETTHVKSKVSSPNYLRFLPSNKLRLDMKAYALGFPGGDSQTSEQGKHPPVTLTEGKLIDLPRTGAGRVRRVYTDVIARPGNSGGAMVDVDGYLIGTVTLMTKPEGWEDGGGANYSALVPMDLTREFVRNAFYLNKLWEGTDFTPFMDVLTDNRGRINLPEYLRLADKDVVHFPNGDRFYGKVTSETITWDSPFGTLTIPAASVAYVMKNDEGAHLFLEGGNRIQSAHAGQKFHFTPQGGTDIELNFDDTTVVGFRTSDRTLEPLDGELIVLDSDLSYLVLSNVEGAAKFETRAGTIDVKMGDIERIETQEPDGTVLSLRDGRRLTGKFDDSKYKGVIAATKTPLEFSLANLKYGSVQTLVKSATAVAGLDLMGVINTENPRIDDLTKKLFVGDPASAKPGLDEFLKPSAFKDLPESDKDKVRLLEAVYLLQSGHYDNAGKAFNKLRKSKNTNIGMYAIAHSDVLKRFGTEYEGKPLSDRAAFVAAGKSMSREAMRDASEFLRDVRRNTGQRSGEYEQSLSRVKKFEDQLKTPSVMLGNEAEDVLTSMWRVVTRACEAELERLNEEERKAQEEAQEKQRKIVGGGGQGILLALQRTQQDLTAKREKVMEVWNEYGFIPRYSGKMFEYGFHIYDPDFNQQRERETERGVTP